MSDDISCSECEEPIASRQDAFELDGIFLCGKCFTTHAQRRRSITGADLKRLRRVVKEELAGLLPSEALRDLIEDGYRRIILKKEDLDVVTGSLVHQIERMAGLALCQRIDEMIQGMKKVMREGLEAEEADNRELRRRLSELNTPG